MHEHGGGINSKGWGYNWDKRVSEEYVLRTHTTSLSVRTLSTLKPDDLPAKFFSVGKVFRNEKLDWKHLFEFYQTDGIVVDEDANFKHLLGYLKRFLNKLGHSKIRFRPAYFPYTEPSIEVDIYNLSLIHISEPTRLLSISYAVFCLKKKKNTHKIHYRTS